jgi:hypothetical protein
MLEKFFFEPKTFLDLARTIIKPTKFKSHDHDILTRNRTGG